MKGIQSFWKKVSLSEEDTEKLRAVAKQFERKSKLPMYDICGKRGTREYDLKIEELNCVTMECPRALKPDIMALDAGCGFGLYSSMLSHKGYLVVGLDVSFGMLKEAKSLVKENNVFFVRGSVTHLPFKEQIFHLILCVNTLHHLTDSFINTAFHEFRRTIRANGMFITDIRNTLNPILFVTYKIGNRKWALIERGGLVLKPRSLMFIKRKLRESGFKPIRSKGIGFSIRMLAPVVVINSEAF